MKTIWADQGRGQSFYEDVIPSFLFIPSKPSFIKSLREWSKKVTAAQTFTSMHVCVCVGVILWLVCQVAPWDPFDPAVDLLRHGCSQLSYLVAHVAERLRDGVVLSFCSSKRQTHKVTRYWQSHKQARENTWICSDRPACATKASISTATARYSLILAAVTLEDTDKLLLFTLHGT